MYTIRLARLDDAPLLPAIERSAGELFRSVADLSWIADDAVQSVERHVQIIESGGAWVATTGLDSPVGFLNGEEMDDHFHIWEMSVHSDHQRQGLGARLIEEVRHFAMERGHKGLTLTTFRDVAWNERFYSRLGFERLATANLWPVLSGILTHEIALGLPGDRRCAMFMDLTTANRA